MLTEAEAKRLAAFDVRTGADQLRSVAAELSYCDELALDEFNTAQLVQLVRMHIASEWEFSIDEWTARQRSDALSGKPPRWDENENPVYE